MNFPVPYILIKKEHVVADGEKYNGINKLNTPGNNGRKIVATEVLSRLGEREISNPVWEVPYILPTGPGGFEIATFTEYSRQDRHKHLQGTEIYTVLKGPLDIYIDDKGPVRVNALDQILLVPGTIHEVVQNKIVPCNLQEDSFCLLVRVVSINCHGDEDKYVQVQKEGEWKLWKTLTDEEKVAAVRMQDNNCHNT